MIVDKTLAGVMTFCPNYSRFRTKDFIVTEWDCGPKCVATFKQRVDGAGNVIDDSLYVGVCIENENVSHYYCQCVYDELPNAVFHAVSLISVRMDAAKLMESEKHKPRKMSRQWNDALQKQMAENHSLSVNFNLMWNDRDKLRDALREVVGWVNLNEAASGICPLPADMVARMRNVLKEVE